MRQTYLLFLLLSLYSITTYTMDPDRAHLQNIFNADYDTQTVEYQDTTWQWDSEFTKNPKGRKVTLTRTTPWYTRIIELTGTFGAMQNVTDHQTPGPLAKVFNARGQAVEYDGIHWQRSQSNATQYGKGRPLTTTTVTLIGPGTFQQDVMQLTSYQTTYDPETCACPSIAKSTKLTTLSKVLATSSLLAGTAGLLYCAKKFAGIHK